MTDIICKPGPVGKAAKAFLAAKTHKMLINGQWVSSEGDETFETLDPATGQVIGHIQRGNAADIAEAVKSARGSLDSGPWPAMTPLERSQLLLISWRRISTNWPSSRRSIRARRFTSAAGQKFPGRSTSSAISPEWLRRSRDRRSRHQSIISRKAKRFSPIHKKYRLAWSEQ